jgi:pimeloyl-ACP methyl ester carboxylesterase
MLPLVGVMMTRLSMSSAVKFFDRVCFWLLSTSGTHMFFQTGCFELLNIRSGAGKSQGRTSWTGKPEIADYVSVAGFLIQYLDFLCPGTVETGPGTNGIKLVLGGYSYGSLIASRLPDIPNILAPFASRTPTDSALSITKIARELSSTLNRTRCPSNYSQEAPCGQGPSSTGESFDNSNAVIASSPLSQLSIDVSYLLVSPLLPPVSVLISLPFGNNPINDINMRKFKEKPTFAIWGDNDIFTSSKKLRSWAEELHQQNQNFLWIEVQGASHFWQETGVFDRLTPKVGEFITLNSKLVN